MQNGKYPRLARWKFFASGKMQFYGKGKKTVCLNARFPIGDREFSDIRMPTDTHENLFAIAKSSFILHFAFYILHFPPDKPQLPCSRNVCKRGAYLFLALVV